ncbi:Fic family protein [Desulfurivibrio alkaliphilus]|uniref:Filamentation induced by cAMP protein Fic n=1 Tax=Desulfurivibrio alkaliphilus (strain DSM 19089 / UNIQEM U267 / AHT2) TaxID=589865 RepID=D6Z3U1_DESAT|nr:Fic family protein [Desulfurivibrio alkaliphilus]ADH86216.1 filamentation induced by cAMP protein Fic [Desulfurivibrio alkaliphilus AHT 2]
MTRYIWQDKAWPHFTWRSDAVLEVLGRCNFMRGRLLGRVASLGMELGLEARAQVLTAEVMQTSAIEGQILNPNSVRSSVARRLGLPEAGASRQDRYTEGLVDVLLDATVNYDQPLTVERLHGWQASLFPGGFSGLHRIKVGAFRGEAAMQVISGPVGREKIHYEAPPGKKVEGEIDKFLNWWQEKQGRMDGILRAALAGFWLVTIHPYEDGNGRLARAVTDMALAQDEKSSVRYYSLSVQILEERAQYYQVLEKCQRGGLDITDWLVWFLGCFERAVAKSDQLIGTVLRKARFWEVNGRVSLTDRQRKVINRLLDAGPEGFSGGLTTRKYAGMTKASRATSYREISDLLNKKILIQNPGKGRSVSYDLAWP